MKEKITSTESASTVCYETMEAHARQRIQSWLQDLLEAEVTEFLGRGISQRRGGFEEARSGYRNGYGKRRRVAMTAGTIVVRRPRMRNLAERFESRVLPLFKRRTVELGAMLPQLYLHGLSSGDFELALRGLLGEGAPRCRRPRWVGSRASGGPSMRRGSTSICRSWSWCTAGPTACT